MRCYCLSLQVGLLGDRSSITAFAFLGPKLNQSSVLCLSCTLTYPLFLLDVMWEKWLISVSYLTVYLNLPILIHVLRKKSCL